nr:MAG TPA: hypothetical protein [Caudoviricetes sp.]
MSILLSSYSVYFNPVKYTIIIIVFYSYLYSTVCIFVKLLAAYLHYVVFLTFTKINYWYTLTRWRYVSRYAIIII